MHPPFFPFFLRLASFFQQEKQKMPWEPWKVVISRAISLWSGSLTRWQLAAIFLRVKRKWTHKQGVFVRVHVGSKVCNKAWDIKTTALFNIHHLTGFCFEFCGVASLLLFSQGFWGFINTSPQNTSHYRTTNCQRTGRSCSVIDLMHRHAHKKRVGQKKSKQCFLPETQLFLAVSPSEKAKC